MEREETACLDENAVVALIAGELTPERRAALTAHLDGCAACRQLVATATHAQTPNDADGDAETADAGTRLTRGSAVGRYIVIDLIGAGGMGVVYAAFDPELDRKVALKLLRPGDAGQGRLVREAKVMAGLSHVNVITVHDVGTHGDRVFIALELLGGGSLSAWLRVETRTWRAILAMFAEVGRGLDAAHAAGLVHRDFKGSNVLLGIDGRPRITDFGLVHVEGASEDERGLIGTPAYMAPEQIEGGTVDARADQFAFCVLLYEALYGERPFAGRTIAELTRAIECGDLRPTPADSRVRVPGWVRKVVLRGLSRSPDARYPSMKELVAALSDDPEARGRRRLAWGGAILIALGGILALRAGAASKDERCTGASKRLEGIWDAPTKESARKAFEATGRPFASDSWAEVDRTVSGYASRWVSLATETCRARRIRGELSDDAFTRRMSCLDRRLVELRVLSRVLSTASAGDVESSVEAAHSLDTLAACSDAQALAARLLSPSDEQAGRDAERLREKIAEGKVLVDVGKPAPALAIASDAVERARSARDRPLEAEALLLRARAQIVAGTYAPARETLLETVHAAEAGRHDEVAAQAWVELLRLDAGYLRDPADAHRWDAFASAALDRLGRPDGGEAGLEHARALALLNEGRPEEALAHARRALVLLEQAFGKDDYRVAAGLNSIGAALYGMGRAADAREHLERALAIRRRVLGGTHPLIGNTLLHLCVALTVDGRAEEGAALCDEAVALKGGALGIDHPEVAEALDASGKALRAANRPEAAAQRHRRAIAIDEQTLGPDHLDVLLARANLAGALTDLGRYDEAALLFERVLATEKPAMRDHPSAARTLAGLADVRLLQGRPTEAARAAEEALAIAASRLGAESLATAEIVDLLGAVRSRERRFPEALALHERSLALFERHLRPEHPSIAGALIGIGRAQVGLGVFAIAGARAPLERALAIFRGDAGATAAAAVARSLLAEALWNGPDAARARQLAEEAEQTLARAGPRYASDLAAVRARLGARAF